LRSVSRLAGRGDRRSTSWLFSFCNPGKYTSEAWAAVLFGSGWEPWVVSVDLPSERPIGIRPERIPRQTGARAAASEAAELDAMDGADCAHFNG
jgi:hypothetical protein